MRNWFRKRGKKSGETSDAEVVAAPERAPIEPSMTQAYDDEATVVLFSSPETFVMPKSPSSSADDDAPTTLRSPPGESSTVFDTPPTKVIDTATVRENTDTMFAGDDAFSPRTQIAPLPSPTPVSPIRSSNPSAPDRAIVPTRGVNLYDTPEAATPLAAGTVLNGRYEVIKPIALGGFSFVYLCMHQRNGRLAAIKEAFSVASAPEADSTVLIGDQARFDVARQSMLTEVSAISQIKHPGIVGFEDVFEQNGTLYFAMDYIEGETLASLIRRRGSLSPETLEQVATSLLDAVEVLHENDVMHGDIKPGNMIVRTDKSVALVDFGTAMRLSDITYPTPIVSQGYSAPERFDANGDLGTWSDVFSCAATLAAAMVGAQPPSPSEEGAMPAFLSRAKSDLFDGTYWPSGLDLGLKQNIAERAATIADLRSSLGLKRQAPAQKRPQSDGRALFISYAHADKPQVRSYVDAIRREGVGGVWIDEQGIAPGSRDWGEKIVNGMRNARYVLLFSSAHSMASQSVIEEIYLARELRKPIIVARLDDTPFADEVLMFLVRSQYVTASSMSPPQFADAILNVLNARMLEAA